MPSFERPPTLAQIERLENEKQAAEMQTAQDLINAHLLQKIIELEAKLDERYGTGDSGDIL